MLIDDPFTGIPGDDVPWALGGFLLPAHVAETVVAPEGPDDSSGGYRARPKRKRRRRRRPSEQRDDLIPILMATMAADEEDQLWP